MVPFYLLDFLIPGWRRSDQMGPPVFIIGNPRSGTTIAHRVLSKDEDRFFYFRTWELIFPSIWQKWILAALGKVDSALGGPWRKLVAWHERRALRDAARYHQLGLFLPEEDDKILMHVLAAPPLAYLFPYADFQRWSEMDMLVPPREQKPVMQFYRNCVLRQSFFKGGRRSLLSKNPFFTGKIRALQKTFPDCRIVYLVRNPLEVIPSTISMLRAMVGTSFRQTPGLDLDRHVYALLKSCYLYALEQVERLPPDRVIVVKYDDLITDPETTFRSIYRHFGWTPSDKFTAALEQEAAAMRQYKSRHDYSLEKFAISAAQILADLDPVFVRYAFARGPVEALAAKDVTICEYSTRGSSIPE